MPITFDGYPLVPAPLVQYNMQPRRDNSDRVVGFDYEFNLRGTIVNVDSSLDSSGAIDATRMQGVLKGQEYIKNLFDVELGLLTITAPETSSNAISAYCRPLNVSFSEGVWVNRSDYTVTLLSNGVNGQFASELESLSENWQVAETENGVFTLTHNIQAKGLLLSGSGSFNDPLAAAKHWVRSRSYQINNAGILSETVGGSGVMALNNLIYALPASSGYWNRQAVETVDPIEYTWSLVESFIYSSGTQGQYVEDYSVTVDQGIDADNKANISVNGFVIGHAGNIRDYNTRFGNASGAYSSVVVPNIYLRAQSFAPTGYSVNPRPISRQVSYERVPGAVRYGYSYVAFNGMPLVSGAIEESIAISDSGPADIFASIDVPGRAKGPIIQYMNTRSSPQRTINISASIMISGGYTIANLRNRYLNKPSTADIIDQLKPESGYYYITQDSEDWNPIRGEYARTISWLIDPLGSGNDSSYRVQGIPYGTHSVSGA